MLTAQASGVSMLRTLKDKLSSKTTTTVDGPLRTRLPPLNHSSFEGACSSGALPPLRGSQPLPPVGVEAKAANGTPNGIDQPNSLSQAGEQTTTFTQNNNSAEPPSYSSLTSNPISQAGNFQTSTSHGYTPPSAQLTTRQQANLTRATHIEQSGIRTYPLFAILSAFLCNPLCGIIAAVLTLIATQNYYNKAFLSARNTAVAANVFIIISVVFGVITYIVLFSVTGVL